MLGSDVLAKLIWVYTEDVDKCALDVLRTPPKAPPSCEWKVLVVPSLRVMFSLDLLKSSNGSSVDGFQ